MICRLFSFGLTSLFCQSSVTASPLELQDALPAVSILDQHGELYALSQHKETEWLLVYFYPKADTPGCTKQACSLRDSYEKLLDEGVSVVGVSQDSVEDQSKFAKKYQLPFTLLADHEAKVIKAFGVPQFPALGMARRQAFLFNKGTLVWRDLKASTEQQAADVLREVQR